MDLLTELRGREGQLYRVELRLAGADPRIALRGKAKLSASDVEELAKRLERMDARSKDGAWTRSALDAIQASPGVRAADLADELGMDKPRFKQRVRKLKELGLTESLEVGYRLSPRGRAARKRLT